VAKSRYTTNVIKLSAVFDGPRLEMGMTYHPDSASGQKKLFW